mmetsp:Transcript_20826/g.51855  ORF Transcript_20826/g.51855 Transcript_20826/m.51855 type:complete len:240 (-) Transcript_20826:40-759(-)
MGCGASHGRSVDDAAWRRSYYARPYEGDQIHANRQTTDKKTTPASGEPVDHDEEDAARRETRAASRTSGRRGDYTATDALVEEVFHATADARVEAAINVQEPPAVTLLRAPSLRVTSLRRLAIRQDSSASVEADPRVSFEEFVGVEALVADLRAGRPEEEATAEAAKALAILARDEAQRAAIVEAGALEALVAVLRESRPEEKVSSCVSPCLSLEQATIPVLPSRSAEEIWSAISSASA